MMPTPIVTATLNVLQEQDGTVHVPASTLPVILNCLNEAGYLVKHSLAVVFLVYDEEAGTLTESVPYVTGAIVATKITDGCTGDFEYVSNPINDVKGAQHPCCYGNGVLPFNAILAEDGTPIETEDNQILIPE